jgi:hypothetical protein
MPLLWLTGKYDQSRYEAGSLVVTAGPWTPGIITGLA